MDFKTEFLMSLLPKSNSIILLISNETQNKLKGLSSVINRKKSLILQDYNMCER